MLVVKLQQLITKASLYYDKVRFIVPYPLIASLLSPNMTAVLTGTCSTYSASCEALKLKKSLSLNCSKGCLTKCLKYVMISAVNLVLIFSKH